MPSLAAGPLPGDSSVIQVGEHLRLRQYQPGDAAALFALVDRNRQHLRARLYWVDRCQAVTDSAAFIARAAAVARTNRTPTWGIWYDGQLAGTVSFHPIDWSTRTALLGYWLDAGLQRRGIVTAAVRALISYGFEQLGVARVRIVCSPNNLSSQAIAAKLGFVRRPGLQAAVWSDDPAALAVEFNLDRP